MNRVYFALIVALTLFGCKAKSATPDVPEGHHLCRYCCSTANVECSCVLHDAVECPDPTLTTKLPACAECRQCKQKMTSDETCVPLLSQ